MIDNSLIPLIEKILTKNCREFRQTPESNWKDIKQNRNYVANELVNELEHNGFEIEEWKNKPQAI